MGTSSSYTSPTSGGWPNAKRITTRFARQGGTGGGSVLPEQVVSAFVKALGGAAAAAVAATTAQSATSNLGSFFGGVAQNGLNQTLQEQGLGDIIGRDTPDVLMALADTLTSSGSTLDATIARTAMLHLLEDVFAEADTYDALTELCTQRINQPGIEQLMERYIVEIVYQHLVQALGERISNGAPTPADIRKIEVDLHAYIVESVKLEFGAIDPVTTNWSGPEGQAIIQRILTDAYGQLE